MSDFPKKCIVHITPPFEFGVAGCIMFTRKCIVHITPPFNLGHPEYSGSSGYMRKAAGGL